MIKWNSVVKDGFPRPLKAVIVTVIDDDGSRYVDWNIRYVSPEYMKKERYCDEYIALHPSGIWEWAYEEGADYWESYDRTIIAWADPDLIEPYLGD